MGEHTDERDRGVSVDLERASDDDVEADEAEGEAEGVAELTEAEREARRERIEARVRRDIERESVEREGEAVENANPDHHRDEEPSNS